jgi:hypothetical protein
VSDVHPGSGLHVSVPPLELLLMPPLLDPLPLPLPEPPLLPLLTPPLPDPLPPLLLPASAAESPPPLLDELPMLAVWPPQPWTVRAAERDRTRAPRRRSVLTGRPGM